MLTSTNSAPERAVVTTMVRARVPARSHRVALCLGAGSVWPRAAADPTRAGGAGNDPDQ
ncbi:hypothetical protein [Granulicoccus phenolivorans]|uniref:hypothetical protein n=1 Tax=Granulicoccus phenolivorans TaxID=266854 RepID=UPI0012DF4E70|nr:hypothetical protein [Granulicoccus phenolivorans]